MKPRANLWRALAPTALLLHTTGCFEDSAPVSESGDTEAATDAASSSGNAGATAPPTADPTGTAPATATSDDASTTAVTPSTGDEASTSETEPPPDTEGASSTGAVDSCQGGVTTCPPAAEFCEGFEGFSWARLPAVWTEVPGTDGLWQESMAPPFCGSSALEALVDEGETIAVIGGALGQGLPLATVHRFGARVRFEAQCFGAKMPPVRALVLQYLAGGSEVQTAEVWFSAAGASLRQDGAETIALPLQVPHDRWLELEVTIDPGVSSALRVNEQSLSMNGGPAIEAFSPADRGQLLVGPVVPGAATALCVESFDDVYFDLLTE